MEVRLNMPDLATVDGEVKVIRWLVDENASIERGGPLVEVETDKATVVVESVATGRLARRLVQPGDFVATGEPLAMVEVAGTTSNQTSAEMTEAVKEPSAAPGQPSLGPVRKPTEGKSFLARNRASTEAQNSPSADASAATPSDGQ